MIVWLAEDHDLSAWPGHEPPQDQPRDEPVLAHAIGGIDGGVAVRTTLRPISAWRHHGRPASGLVKYWHHSSGSSRLSLSSATICDGLGCSGGGCRRSSTGTGLLRDSCDGGIENGRFGGRRGWRRGVQADELRDLRHRCAAFLEKQNVGSRPACSLHGRDGGPGGAAGSRRRLRLGRGLRRWLVRGQRRRDGGPGGAAGSRRRLRLGRGLRRWLVRGQRRRDGGPGGAAGSRRRPRLSRGLRRAPVRDHRLGHPLKPADLARAPHPCCAAIRRQSRDSSRRSTRDTVGCDTPALTAISC